MKIIKRLLLTLITIVITLTLALLFVASNIDPNDYKEKIEALVEQTTGHKLHIEGSIELILFPTLSIDIKQVAINNPPGFEGQLISAQRLLAKLDLLPLLQKRLEIGKISLYKPQLRLHTLSNGHTNWAPQQMVPRNDVPTDTPFNSMPLISSFSLAGILIEDANITWHNEQMQEHIQVNTIHLKTGALASGKPADFSLSGKVHDQNRQLFGDFRLDSSISVDPSNQRVGIKQFTSEINLHNENQKPLNIRLNTNAMINLIAEKIVINHLSANIAGISINGNADIVGLSDTAKITISLKSDDFSPHIIATVLKKQVDYLPELVKFDLDATIDLEKDIGIFRKLIIDIDEAHFEGAASVTALLSNHPKINAKITSNTFNLREISNSLNLELPKTIDNKAFHRFAASSDFSIALGADKAHVMVHQSKIKFDDSELYANGKIQWLPILDINLKSNIDRINLASYLLPDDKDNSLKNLHITDLETQIDAQDKTFHVPKLSANIFGGQINGSFSIDMNSKTKQNPSTWRSRGNAKNINLEQLLTALSVENKKQLKGTGAATWQLTATGDEIQALTQSLAGSLQVKLEKIALKDKNLAKSIDHIIAFFEKRPSVNTDKTLMFNHADATFSLDHGLANNRNLKAQMPLLNLRGAGEIDLAKSRMNYQINAQLLRQKEKQHGGKSHDEDFSIPIKITGPFNDLKYSVDLKTILQEQAEKRLIEEKERLQERIGDTLDDILKRALKLPF